MRKQLQFLFVFGGVVFFLFHPCFLLADGIMKYNNNDELLPLVKSQINIDIFEQVAVTTVEHTFFNDIDQDSSDVKYMFPLPENASVIQFGIYIDDSTFVEFEMTVSDTGGGHGNVSDEEEDLANYLLPNPFVIPLKIAPGTQRIQMKYVELLPYYFGKIQLEYPLYSDQFLKGIIEYVSIDINLTSQRRITEITSNSHAINIDQPTDFAATIDYSLGNANPERNFDFRFALSQDDIGLFNFCYRDPADSTETDGYFLILIEPGKDITPSEILQKYFSFIMDRSGSMSGHKIVQAKQAANYCIEHLNENDLFNIIDFSSYYNSFANEPVLASVSNVQSAVSYVNDINAGGSTNIYDPVMFSLQQSLGEGTANQILLLTDGHHNTGSVTNLDQVIQLVTEANTQDVNIFVFGIGNYVDKGFLQSLANNNHGLAVFVNETEPIDEVIAEFFLRINNPVLINIALNYGGAGANDIYPNELLDIFTGTQLVVTGRYSTSVETDITLSGSVSGADTSIIYPNVNFPEADTDYPFVPKIWAKSKIEYLYQQWLILGEPDSLKEQIVDLSVKYGVLSPFTQYSPPEPPPTAVEEELEMVALSATWQMDKAGASIKIAWNVNMGSKQDCFYNIYRSRSERGDFIKLNSNPLTLNEFIDRDVTAGQTYYYQIEVIQPTGQVQFSQIVESTVSSIETFELHQNYPNPFNSSTMIKYTLLERAFIEVKIYDMLGRHIRTLAQTERNAGRQSVKWDGRDTAGMIVASGIYFVRLQTGSSTQVKKMMLLQ